MTKDQAKFLSCITGVGDANGMSLEQRVAKSLDPNNVEPWRSALIDLITILGDTDENYESIDSIEGNQLTAMRRNWHDNADEQEIRSRIIYLRQIYDWPALKSLVRICPGSSGNDFAINDLFNLLDLHIPLGFGVHAPAQKDAKQFFDARRLIGAKNALRMILGVLFYIDYQDCIRSRREILSYYYDFAMLLGRRMQRQGLNLACNLRFEKPEFYRGDVGFVSLNYDPICLWIQFLANRELNRATAVPHIGSPAVRLELFHDSGYMIPSRRINGNETDWPWYWMDEAVCQRLNEQASADARVRLTKFLFPHGCLCWRECPNCRKLSAYYGDEWRLDARGLLPPPPLRAFDTAPPPVRISGDERCERQRGAVDARACLHCGTLTYAEHTQTVMQSTFKSPPPSFIEEIQRDLRAATMQATHIIFMGYSLPPDDFAYRTFFSACLHRGEKPVRCTIVDKDDNNSNWCSPKTGHLSKNDTVTIAVNIFGRDNVRFFGGGIPTVFLDGANATDAKLDELLTWSLPS
jgi:hypothetical protein